MSTNPYMADPKPYPQQFGSPPPINEDDEHLNLLAVFHYVLAALSTLCSFCPVIYLVLGIAMLSGQMGGPNGPPPPPPELGWMFVVVAAAAMMLGMAISISILIAGRCLAKRTGRIFCIVIAALECVWFPIGTALGVFTLLVLLRPSVRQRFESLSRDGF